MLRLSHVIAFLAISGCGDLSYVTENYDDIPTEMFAYDGRDWGIDHDSANDRMIVTAGAGQTILNSGSFGLAQDPAAVYRLVAQAYLDSKSIPCRAVGATSVLVSYEVTYLCQ